MRRTPAKSSPAQSASAAQTKSAAAEMWNGEGVPGKARTPVILLVNERFRTERRCAGKG